MPDFTNIFDLPSLGDLVEVIKQNIILTILATYSMLGDFSSVNPLYGEVYSSLGSTPSQWNFTIYGAITGMTKNVLMPVAGVITAFVLSFDLVQSVNTRNNMQVYDSDTGMFIKWLIKAMIAVTLVSHSMEIVNGIFYISSWVVTKATEYFSTESSLTVEALSEFFVNSLYEKSIPELLLIQGEIMLSTVAVAIMLILATVIIWSRMIEIFMVIAASPIPLATLVNREWSDVGKNYIKLICAYALQAYLIMIVFAVYSALIKNVAFSASVTKATITLITYTFLFGYMFFKTEGLAKSIFCAH